MKKAQFTGCPNGRLSFNSCWNCPDYDVCQDRIYEKRHNKRVTWAKFWVTKIICFLGFVLIASFVLSSVSSIDSEARSKSEVEVVQDSEESENTQPTNLTENEEKNIQETETTIEETTESEGTENTEESVDALPETTTESPQRYEPRRVRMWKISPYQPYNEYVYDICEEDKILIAKLVLAESVGECYEGKVAVAATPINRYFSKCTWFERESMYAVITQEFQFAEISNITIEDLEEYPECLMAVEDACKGWDPTRAEFENGALFFYNPKKISGYQAQIREGIKVMVIGNHNFHENFDKIEVEE